MTAAVRTADFIATLGVNTHIGSAADGYQNLSVVAASINYLGLKNLRDSPLLASGATTWLQVAQATGAKFDAYEPLGSPSTMQASLNQVPQLASEGILNYVEGGNEEDDAYPVSVGNSLAITAQFQQQVYQVGHSLGLPVINMSFGAGWTADNNWQGDYGAVGDLSAYADFANAHTYPQPGQLPDSTVQRLSGLAHLAASSRPVITTEIGWNRARFSPDAIAKYALDAAMDGMKDGDAQMYFYSLFDNGAGQYGLMNQDGTTLPVGQAIHNLTTLLADGGASARSFTPGSFNYTLSQTTAHDNSLLFEKSDGTYWLAVWDEVDPAHQIGVALPSPAAEIRVFDPLTGTAPIQDVKGVSSVTVGFTDHPLLIEFTPPSTANMVTLASNNANPVVNASATTIIAEAGNHNLFIGGINDIAILTGGTETVQAYHGSNNIRTGAGNDTIRIAGSGNVADAGSGANAIYDSGSGNTLVMPTAGSDDVFGYVLQHGDKIDFRTVLAELTGSGSQPLSDFIHVGMSGSNAIITTTTASGDPVSSMQLHSSGLLSMDGLLAHSIF